MEIFSMHQNHVLRVFALHGLSKSLRFFSDTYLYKIDMKIYWTKKL